MSFAQVKHWLATVDLSETDWRLRWPLILLPLLLIALFITLLQANRVSAKSAEAQQHVQTILSSDKALSMAAAGDSASGSTTQLRIRMQQLDANARQLHAWLTQGRSSEALAQQALALVELTTSFNQGNSALPDVAFWKNYSDVLARLELGVIDGVINTPESEQAVTGLRSNYATLRASMLNVPTTESANNTEQSGASAESSASDIGLLLQEISGASQRAAEQRVQLTRLTNRALILSALSALMLGLLLWGLWRNTQHRSNAVAGRTRSEQSAILRLLDEITPLAQGDLRVKATVSEASTGAIADAFNYAVDELRRLVMAVTESADLVKKSVSETRESTQQLAKASSVQAREIHRSSNYLNVMSDTMAQLSAHAVESSRIADLSVEKARAGNVALKSNVDGLLRIREQATMTTRMMQRLVETSEAINEHAGAIQSVARQTDLLAMNATIKTAAAVNDGSGNNIAMLSDEVSYLSDTLGRASRDITRLSDLIQQDANLTLDSMAKTVAELDDGQDTAKLASDNLNEIDRVSHELNALISDIASKSLRQAGVVKQLSANMGVINNITRDSTLELQGSANALDSLQTMTTELRESVSDFKLPRSTQQADLDDPGYAQKRLDAKHSRNKVTHA